MYTDLSFIYFDCVFLWVIGMLFSINLKSRVFFRGIIFESNFYQSRWMWYCICRCGKASYLYHIWSWILLLYLKACRLLWHKRPFLETIIDMCILKILYLRIFPFDFMDTKEAIYSFLFSIIPRVRCHPVWCVF